MTLILENAKSLSVYFVCHAQCGVVKIGHFKGENRLFLMLYTFMLVYDLKLEAFMKILKKILYTVMLFNPLIKRKTTNKLDCDLLTPIQYVYQCLPVGFQIMFLVLSYQSFSVLINILKLLHYYMPFLEAISFSFAANFRNFFF